MTNKTKKQLISDDETLTGCKNEYGRQLKIWDDGFGQLYVFSNSLGVGGVVRAMSESDAWECVSDEIKTPIAVDDLPTAYGSFDKMCEAGFSASFAARWHDVYFHVNMLAKANPTDGEYPELIEGYELQSNATATGIVNVDLNGERLEVLTPELAAELNLTVQTTVDD